MVKYFTKTKQNNIPFSPAHKGCGQVNTLIISSVFGQIQCDLISAGGIRLRFHLFEVLWRCFTISKKEMPINEEIREKEIRVIGPDGNPLGIMSSKEALQIAQRENLDLVNISPKAVPPVCKIMNYGKYRFEQAKREKEAKKKQKTVEIKEIRLSLKIDTHDFETKVNQAKKFLEHGDRVKVAIRFRGREMAHPELGNATIKRFADACADVGVIDKLPKMEGRSLIMFISAKPASKTTAKQTKKPVSEKPAEKPAEETKAEDQE